jgi:hypothetical protein
MANESPEYLRKLGELLVFHEILDAPEELTSANLKEVVTTFQEKEGLFADGVPGRNTLWALQEPWLATLPKQLLIECDADVAPGGEGLSKTKLRQDAADRFNNLRDEIHQAGGLVTSDGGLRELTADVNQNRSPTSMHYTGLAFDLYTSSGFFKPDQDPFVITRGENTFWIVWCRATNGEQKELNAVHWKNWNSGVDLVKAVSGRFVNFTEAAQRHGFQPIGPRTPFTRTHDRDYLSAEWWHFQCNELLIPNLSQFGIELQKIKGYTPNFIASKSADVWSNRRVIFRQNWR